VIIKKCSKCKIEKELENFRNRSDHKHLKTSSCKDCEAEYGRIRNEKDMLKTKKLEKKV